MKRERLTPIKMLNKPHYRSILFLLKFYQNGLTRNHLNYVLIKNYRKNISPQAQSIIKEMEIFFDYKLVKLIKKRLVEEGCITSRQNMHKFLRNLEKINAIEKNKTKKDNIRYVIKDGFKEKLYHELFEELLKKLDELETTSMFVGESFDTGLTLLKESKYGNIYFKIEG